MSEPFLFVSHVTEDRAPAIELVDELERRGVSCWIAPRDVRPGKPYDDEIAEAIDGCAAMLLIFSEYCNESQYIRREITVAGEAQKLVIPFRIEDVQPKRGLRIRLADLHWIDGFIAREQAVDAVIRSVSKDAGAWRGSHRASAAEAAVTAPPAAPAAAREPPATPRAADAASTASQPPLGESAATPAASPIAQSAADSAGPGNPTLAELLARLPPSLQEHVRKADAGDPESLYVVGLFQRFGGYTGPLTQNPAKALETLRRSAAQGHAGAQHQIGLMHCYGAGLEKDIKRAAEWFAKAAEQGHRGALCDLARLYEQGEGVELDREKALALYREAVARGAFWAGRSVARLSGALADAQTPHEELEIPTLSESDRAALRETGWPWDSSGRFQIPTWDLDDLARRAAAGKAEAQYVIGHKLRIKSPETALRWFRLSAAQGFPPAQFHLGLLYQDGKGVDRDPREAADWFENAASAGELGGLHYLGCLYETGLGVPKDLAKALLLQEEARARGYAYLAQRRIEYLTPMVAEASAKAATAAPTQSSGLGVEVRPAV